MAADLLDWADADALEGCNGCLHGGHCLPLLLLMAAAPVALVWWW